jgi:hypothetical protein
MSATDLQREGQDPNDLKQVTLMQPFKHVWRSVDLSRVDLVKQCHHDENVENKSEMLVWLTVEIVSATAVDVKKQFTFITEDIMNIYSAIYNTHRAPTAKDLFF